MTELVQEVTAEEVAQGYLFELPLTPVQQMIVGLIISVVIVLLKFIEGI